MSFTDRHIEAVDARIMEGVLCEIADIASGTIDPQELLDRVATSVRRVIPFHSMAVVRIADGERAVLHAAACSHGDSRGASVEIPLTAWSPRWRPGPGPCPRIADARTELDPAFPMDAAALEEGMGSGLWEPFRQGNAFAGGVALRSLSAHAFTGEHQEALRPIAALLGLAAEHWQILETERRRRERLDQVESHLGTLAESLDVREVFERLSAEMQTLLPHDLLNLTEIDMRARTIRIVAFAGGCDLPIRTDPFPLLEQEIEDRINFAIVHDISSELEPATERNRLILASGMRSWLHVPVLLSGEIKGSLSFLHRQAARYSHDDAEIARRIADRVALTLSHQQLAQEVRFAAQAQERAERLEATVETLARELGSRAWNRIVGVSRSWKDTLRAVGRVAPSDTTVLITGESGTGKEIVSNLIHQASRRSGKPFVAINCAALPDELLESELFGHERGAFTGAVARKIGRVEQAQGGTLFLDEIAEMTPIVQAKFLRLLEEREFQRLGGTGTLRADVRVIAATNRDLAAAIARRSFREDLYYRLNVFHIHITPLRDRPEDILPLAEAFLADLGRSMGRHAGGVSRDARQWLLDYPWPGNVRELRNAIERAILLCDGGLITRDHLPSAPLATPGLRGGAGASSGAAAAPSAESLNVEQVERGLIEKALARSRGNKSRAAQLLGLSRAQLYARMEKYGLG